MSTIAELAARRAELEAELSKIKEEIAARAGQSDEPPVVEPAPVEEVPAPAVEESPPETNV